MKRLLSLFLLLLLTSELWAQTAEIEAILRSVELRNLALQSLRCEQQATVQELKADNTPNGPTVEYSPFYGEGYTGIAESELVVSEEFDFPTRYASRNHQVKLQQQVNDQQYRAARSQVLLQAELLCYEVIHSNEVIQMLKQRLIGSDSLLLLFEKRMEAGDANILELNKVKLERMEVLTQVSSTENERQQYLSQLQTLNGGDPVSLALTSYPEPKPCVDFVSFLNEALVAHPDILSAQAGLKVAKNEVNLSRQEWLPSLSLGYRRNTNGKESVKGFLVGASFPLLGNASRVKAAKQRQLSAELQLQDAELNARIDLESRYKQLLGLQRVLADCDTQMMKQTLALLGKALQHGEISALQYYTETSSIYQKLEEHMAVHCEAAKLQAELYYWQR